MRSLSLIDVLKGAVGASPRPAELQVGALCWREVKGRKEILLVRTLNTRRWIIPKGWPMNGRSLMEAAAIEAWEEAGVTGSPDDAPVGSYLYDKITDSGLPVRCEVRVFPIRVEKLADKYPEAGRRERKWASPEKASELAGEADLKRLLKTL